MTLPPLADLLGLEARGADTSNSTRAVAAITDVSALIHSETGNRWITDTGDLDPATPPVVFTVAYRVIRRTLANPDDVTSDQIGPFQQTRAADGNAYLTASDKSDLAGATGNTSGLSVIRLEAPWPVHTRNVDCWDDDE